MNLTETKDFIVHTKSLKEVRVFSREVFEKLKLDNELKDEFNDIKEGVDDIEESIKRKL